MVLDLKILKVAVYFEISLTFHDPSRFVLRPIVRETLLYDLLRTIPCAVLFLLQNFMFPFVKFGKALMRGIILL